MEYATWAGIFKTQYSNFALENGCGTKELNIICVLLSSIHQDHGRVGRLCTVLCIDFAILPVGTMYEIDFQSNVRHTTNKVD